MFTPGEGISRIFCASTYKKRQKRSKMSKVVKENENVISLKIGRNSSNEYRTMRDNTIAIYDIFKCGERPRSVTNKCAFLGEPELSGTKENDNKRNEGVLPSLVPFFHSNYAPILTYNLDSSSRIFHYARLSAAAGLFIQSMPCLILSTLQPFTSQNDVLEGVLPSLVPFFHSNYAPILTYNLDSSSRIFHYARLSAAAGLFIQSMPCLIVSTLQPFTSQNDVLYRSLPPILNGKDVNGRKVEAVHWKNHLLPGQNCKNLYFQESSNKVQKAEAFFVARRLTDGKKRAQL
ncbi:hypothetical protein T4D_14903 [Trichinella pseudospiralis]|uniref:Uncharacterized protein n=1 Tax=Trichinella pseudospiralis TaxID=6337 RepID=A0A0V1F4R4_TRIPS|nr:hypothetical protein T4D_14903 [Trichinella pseudospiralis]